MIVYHPKGKYMICGAIIMMPKIGRNIRLIQRSFFRNLMALICSFRKRKELTDSSFKEEYVVPQLFTQILKSKNYKGICYYSTKPFEAYSYSTADTNMPRTGKNMLYKENIVFFTDQSNNSQESYDLALFDCFETSMPASIGNKTRIAGENLDELVETIRLATKDTISDVL